MDTYIQTIEKLFGQYEWLYERLDEASIVSGFQGEVTTFQFFVKIADDRVHFVLVPFIDKPQDAYKTKLFEYLLQLNYEMDIVKFGIDEDGDIFLAVELPVSDLDYEHFSDALDALSYYADKYYLQTLNLATNPTHRPLSEG